MVQFLCHPAFLGFQISIQRASVYRAGKKDKHQQAERHDYNADLEQEFSVFLLFHKRIPFTNTENQIIIGDTFIRPGTFSL